MKKKVTKHVVGDVYTEIDKWAYEMDLIRDPVFIDGIIFSNDGSKGRDHLFDASKNGTGDIFAYWKDEERGILEISAPKPGTEIRAPKNMRFYFSNRSSYRKSAASSISYLDVSHLDVSKTTDFNNCFYRFGARTSSKIVGLENWNISSGNDFREMFHMAFLNNDTVSLDLSSWKFSADKNVFVSDFFREFAPAASKVELNLSWDTYSFVYPNSVFDGFAPRATNVNLIGVEDWNMKNAKSFNAMFKNFAPNSSCKLDLTGWSKGCSLIGTHHKFADGNFFRIKEPVWENY